MKKLLSIFLLLLCIQSYGQVQNALDFDGTDDKVTITHNSIFNFGTSTNFTIEFWVKFDGSQNNFDGLVAKMPNFDPSDGWQIVVYDNKIAAQIQGNVNTQITGTSSLNDNKWHHIAMVVDRSATNAKVYLDGALEINVTNSDFAISFDNSFNILLGVDRVSSNYFNGLMDEIRIWNVARTATQIQQSMRTEVSASSTGLIAYYTCNNTSGTSMTDATSNGNNGTLSGFALTGSTSNWVESGAGFRPSITSLSANSGIAGSSITISGDNFNSTTSNNIVYFGTVKATVTAASTSSLTVTVPTGSNYGPVSVTNSSSALTAVSTSNFSPIYSPGKSSLTINDFGSPSSFNLTGWSLENAHGDFDGDGKPDFISTTYNSGTNPIFVHRNTGSSGTFNFAASITLISSPIVIRGITVADFDGDGKLDIAVAGENNNLSVFLNTSTVGNISFATKADFAMTGYAGDITSGDLNGDGRPELIVTSGNTLNIFQNKSIPGTISFATKMDIAGTTGQVGVGVADINNDGMLDIITANDNASNLLSIYRNTTVINDTIRYASASNFSNGTNRAKYLSIADIDSDGLLDIVASSISQNGCYIFRNTSSGNTMSIGSTTLLSMNGGTYRMAVGDYNSDGKPEVFAYRGGYMQIYRNNSTSGSMTFDSFFEISSPSGGFASVNLVDMDTDGKIDLVAMSDNGFLRVYRNEPLVYYSVASGNANTASNWNSKSDGTGTSASNLTTATNYTVQNGHTMTTSAALSFGSSGSILVVQNGGIFVANHSITMASGTALQIETGGTFNANVSQTFPTMYMIGGKYSIAAGTSLTINGSANTTSGVFSGTSTSDLTIGSAAGTILFDQTTPGTTNVLRNIVLGSGSAASITLGNTLNIASSGGITFNASGTKSIATGGYLKLKSDANGTAYIGNVNGATITGNITVERYLPARRAFRFLSTPVTTTNGIDDNWQQQTHITGTGTGFDLGSQGQGNPSLFTLNEATQGWVAVTNTQTQNLTQGVGYRILVRGDRSISLDQTNPTPIVTTLSASGEMITGDFTFNTASTPALTGTLNNYSFIGNPFASAINWSNIGRTNVSNTYYTWRAQGGTNSRGAYVSFNASGNSSSDGNVNQFIGSGSAIMVQTTGASPSIIIEEQDKATSEQGSQILGKTNNPNSLRITLFEDDTTFADGLFIFQNETASDGLDEFDSEKWINPGISLYSYTSDNKKTSIQGFNTLLANKVINLGMEKTEIKSYKLLFSELENFQSDVYLVDHYLNKEIKLNEGSSYVFSVTSESGSSAADRFNILFKNTTGINKTEMSPWVNLFPNPAKDVLYVSRNMEINNNVNFTIFDQLGKVLKTGQTDLHSNHIQSITIDELSNGIYFLKLSYNTASQTYKFIK